MITIEQIDELRKRVNVSYEDAKEALENSNEDILEAILYLEKNGKIKKEEENKDNGESFSKVACGFIGWCKKWIKKGNRNYLTVTKRDNVILKLSLTISAIIIIIAPYISIPLLILALFTGHKFRVHGEDVDNTKVNDTLNKMSNTADHIKEEFVK
ncbi:DUF4342 domain-containing protein [Clostridium hydrogeniformans]|uniref:DUF4342 domain-containing protein n=1 Tax=Clostridium hydrogeniformans TaxID=349933 RepID=UPI0005508929|nr:DUF4342 domain-containing protein [Clostridium hydrogeniformans]